MIDFKGLAINANVDDREYKQAIYDKRIKLIEIARKWEGCDTQNHFVLHKVWQYPKDTSYTVCFGKYGKEYYEIKDGERKNANDMKPCVFNGNNIVVSFRGRFDDIFALFEELHREGNDEAVKALAILFYRNALLLDHCIVNGNYQYSPNQELVNYICSIIEEYEGIPMEVYIHILDAIGYNEDVKYYTQNKLQKKTGIGRENNMKTYVYAALCVLGVENWSAFIYKLMRGYGVAPISNKVFATYFPELGITYNVGTTRAKRVNNGIVTIERTVVHL